MDTSLKYIAMCGRARNFRKTWVPAIGDYYYERIPKTICVVNKLPHVRINRTWLPRADQLFMIAQQRYDVKYRATYTINQFHQYIVSDTPEIRDSLEQLLLQFVMCSVYQLRFVGGCWIKCLDDV